MKPFRLSLVVVCLVLLTLPAAAVPVEGPVSPEEAGKYLGKVISVEGRVYQVRKSATGIHLYFDADPTRGFQALVPSSAVYKFKVDPTVHYDKRNVRVSGKVEEDNGRYFIRLTDPNDIKIVPRKRGTTD